MCLVCIACVYYDIRLFQEQLISRLPSCMYEDLGCSSAGIGMLVSPLPVPHWEAFVGLTDLRNH